MPGPQLHRTQEEKQETVTSNKLYAVNEIVTLAAKGRAGRIGQEFRPELLYPLTSDSPSACALGTENLGEPRGELQGGFPDGIATSRAAVKPKAILFVSVCFHQIVEVLNCLEMKGVLVGAIFHTSGFCPPGSIHSPVPTRAAVCASVAASRSKGDARPFCNCSDTICKLKYV